MRGSLGLLKKSNGIIIGATTNPGIGNCSKLVSSYGFSSSSSSGSGRGRGGLGPRFNFSVDKSDSDVGPNDSDVGSTPSSGGVGHGVGRGKPLSFNSFVGSNPPRGEQPGVGRGRGGVGSGNGEDSGSKKPVFFVRDEATGGRNAAGEVSGVTRRVIGEVDLPPSIVSTLSGSGRGKPVEKPVFVEVAKEENRHLRPRRGPSGGGGGGGEDVGGGEVAAAADGEDRGKGRRESGEGGSDRRKPKLSRDEAVKKAVGILSKREEDRGEVGEDRRGSGRGRGRGRGSGVRFRRRPDDWEDDEEEGDEDEDEAEAMFDDGDEADAERLAEFLGPEKMNELTEEFEDMSYDVLPDPEYEEYIDGLDTNLKIELEPEYLLGDFEKNPDIDEKPQLSLREALEKIKPFLMAYEGIESQEEWEEAVKEAMDRVPLLKEIVDHYCGPDRVTAKQQQGELERVAKTLPASAPDSVKRFTERAVLSLQSNPGWGFHRKCQFMDKLVDDISKSYK